MLMTRPHQRAVQKLMIEEDSTKRRRRTLNARNWHWSGYDSDCVTNWNSWAWNKRNLRLTPMRLFSFQLCRHHALAHGIAALRQSWGCGSKGTRCPELYS